MASYTDSNKWAATSALDVNFFNLSAASTFSVLVSPMLPFNAHRQFSIAVGRTGVNALAGLMGCSESVNNVKNFFS